MKKNEDIDIDGTALLFHIPSSFYYGIDKFSLYEITRGTWHSLPKGYENAELAMPVFDDIIQEVYEIAEWCRSDSTQNLSKNVKDCGRKKYEFVGRVAGDEIRLKYRYKSIANTVPRTYGNSVIGLNLN